MPDANSPFAATGIDPGNDIPHRWDTRPQSETTLWSCVCHHIGMKLALVQQKRAGMQVTWAAHLPGRFSPLAIVS